ncbi:MAG: hypothetical protein ACOX7F_07760 [Eubacteriales bacterium]|jgi:hypothetical protein
MWKEPLLRFAREQGGEYIGQPARWNEDVFVCLPGEPRLYISMSEHMDALHNERSELWPTFRVAAVLECRNPITVKIRPASLLRKGLGLLQKPLQVGDPEVDGRYVITSPQPQMARQLLGELELRQQLAVGEPCSLQLTPVEEGASSCLIEVWSRRAPFTAEGRELVMEEDYDPTHMEHMVALCRAFWNAADRWL